MPSRARRHLFVMVVVLVAGAFFLAAPDNTKPEKIIVGITNWNNTSQSFDVDLLATASLADDAEREGYVLVTTLTLSDRDGNLVETIGPQEDQAEKGERAADESRGLVPLEPLHFFWERGEVSGWVRVDVTGELQTPSSEPVAGYSKDKILYIGHFTPGG